MSAGPDWRGRRVQSSGFARDVERRLGCRVKRLAGRGYGLPAARVSVVRHVRRGIQDRGVSIEIDDSTLSILWSQTQDRPLRDPERQLLAAIAAGELDRGLVAIADAVHARRLLLDTVRSARAIVELCVGDTVMFTNRIRPRYLEHELAEVTEVDERMVTVRLAAGRTLRRGRASVPAARATPGRPSSVDPAQLTVRLSGDDEARRQPTNPVDPLPVLRGSEASGLPTASPEPLCPQNFQSSRAERC